MRQQQSSMQLRACFCFSFDQACPAEMVTALAGALQSLGADTSELAAQKTPAKLCEYASRAVNASG